jgi:HD-like signal output (HDOD) protein
MQVEASQEKSAKISSFLKKVSEIPPLPSVTSRILEVAENPLSSAHELTDIISNDPALTAQILKAANSAFYGFPNKIGTIYLAIVILGFNMVRTIALSSGVLKVFSARDSKKSLLKPDSFWEHSLKTGVACKILAKRYKYYLSGEAFTAGLLHDIGRIILAHYNTTKYNDVIKHSAKQRKSLLDSEVEILGFSHADVGGVLLQDWNLPLAIADAVSFHHSPTLSKHVPDLASLTQVGDYLAHLHSFRNHQEPLEPVPNIDLWGTLAVPEDPKDAIESLLIELDHEIKKAETFFAILKG